MDVPAPFGSLTLAEFEERLASAEPVPGGGSASAIAGSMAASLLAMVGRLSLDRPKYAVFEATCRRAIATGDSARKRLLELADEDSQAYAAFAAARKLPRDTDEERRARDEASRVAAREASEVPLEVVRVCARVIYEVEAMSGRSNLNASSDLEVAARLASAGARGAAANVMINLPMAGDEPYADAVMGVVGSLLDDIERGASAVTERVRSGSLRDPEPA